MLWFTVGINWYHRISNLIEEMSHKPMSLYEGSTARTRI
jgi:hypothetical protein